MSGSIRNAFAHAECLTGTVYGLSSEHSQIFALARSSTLRRGLAIHSPQILRESIVVPFLQRTFSRETRTNRPQRHYNPYRHTRSNSCSFSETLDPTRLGSLGSVPKKTRYAESHFMSCATV